MALRLNGSSSGYVELDVPAAAGSHTLTLPNSGGSSGDYLRTDGSGVLSWQTPAGGKILQVVHGNYSTSVPTTSTSYVDTGLSVSITPSSTSSKILVLVSQTLSPTTSGSSGFGRYQVLRGASSIYVDERINLTTQYLHSTYSVSVLDSPSSTSSVTYKTQMATNNSSYTLEAQHGSLRTSTMALIEVAA